MGYGEVWNEENKKVWAQHNSNFKTGIDETKVYTSASKPS